MASDYYKKKAVQEKKDADKRPARIKDACESLREFVDNLNKAPSIGLRGSIFQGMDKDQVFTCKVDGWEFGYRLVDCGVQMQRRCFIKAEQPLKTIPDSEKDPVVMAAMDAFLDPGQGNVEIAPIAPDCLLVTQMFVPLFLIEKNPNIIVPKPLKNSAIVRMNPVESIH